jgi:hypothetical protein
VFDLIHRAIEIPQKTKKGQLTGIEETTDRNFSPPIASQVQVGSSMQMTVTEGAK